jgi:geranylgeranyl diphosphate synthase type I
MSATDSAAAERVLAYLSARRAQITTELSGYLAAKGRDLETVGPRGRETCALLYRFTENGKMVRGGLVCYAASLGSARAGAPVRVGMAIELLQSALLIHDDIMDQDLVRRGQPSVHHEYALRATRDGLGGARHLGESLGICAGDIAFFLAFDALAQLDCEADVRARLVSLVSRELSLVGVAQMMDVATGASSADPGTEDVLRLYLYKTGRYTFSLPLLAGALLGSLEPRQTAKLESAGELLGMLFQIKDDELGLFGDPAHTGKPAGSDIREGKKTIHHAFLVRHAPPEELERIRSIWGARRAAQGDVRYLLDGMERWGVRDRVADLARSLAARASSIVADRPFLQDLLEYSLARTY